MALIKRVIDGLSSAVLVCSFVWKAEAAQVQQVGDVFNNASDTIIYVLPMFALGMTLGARDYVGTGQFAKSAVTAMALTAALKYTINETRPNGDPHSFPSGHTAITVTSAEFLRRRYGWKYGLPAYVLATYVGYERIKDHEHYTWDVATGAAISFASTTFFTKPYKGWTVTPVVTSREWGLRLTRVFQ